MRGAETFFGVRAVHPRAMRLPYRSRGAEPDPHNVELPFLRILGSIHSPRRKCQSSAACARTRDLRQSQRDGRRSLVYAILRLLRKAVDPQLSVCNVLKLITGWTRSYSVKWRQGARARPRSRNRQTEECATPDSAKMVRHVASTNGRPVENPVGMLYYSYGERSIAILRVEVVHRRQRAG